MIDAPRATDRPALTFGVAGHVDHGKTAMVRSLTGVETDRLAEEQRRGISIELGFAPVDLQTAGGDDVRVGLVDMPGHERFVRRMIAGAVGIDAVLLVVAADEGVMPQAREHLAICELLGVQRGVIVLNKVDLLGDDPDLLDLLELELGELGRGTFLEGAPVLRFSSRTPDALLPGLRAGLGALAEDVLALRDAGGLQLRPFRLPVDRAFTLRGRGTIVTGTAAAGSIREGESLRAAPGERRYRVRGIERHGVAVSAFDAPGRVALNLAAAEQGDLGPGTVLCAERGVVVSDRLDVWLAGLPWAPAPIARRNRLALHVGTARVGAAIVPLDREALAPGEQAPAQLHLDEPVAVAPGERFVLRGSHDDPRHGRTVAGGRILLTRTARHRLDDPEVLAALEAIALGTDEQAVVAAVGLAGIGGLDEAGLADRLPLPPPRLQKVLAREVGRGRLRRLGTPGRYLVPEATAALEQRALAACSACHQAAPERAGVDRAEIARRIGDWLDASMIQAVLDGQLRRGELVEAESGVALAGFRPHRVAARDEVLRGLREVLRRGRWTPPIGDALRVEVGERAAVDPLGGDELRLALDAETESGRAIRVTQDFYLDSDAAVALFRAVLDGFAERDGFSTGELKDALGVTRKHLIPLAELLDARRLTVRDPSGQRRLRARALQAHRDGDDVATQLLVPKS
ncbi:MAG: SelB C-terminal domain-containing protein [Deltaproteobacteria bacterium]|nr:SelB C-terminal domain-containing protein [Deltaproteobacteria bacterium]